MKARNQCDGPADLRELAARLKRRSCKFTGPRQLVIEILGQSMHPLSIREVFAQMKSRRCDLASVYRTVHLLEGLGLVKRFDFGDGVARYELLRAGRDGHHHHLICRQCALVIEVEECAANDLERRIASRSGFAAITHNLEFFGICPSCQGKG